jgi:integrase
LTVYTLCARFLTTKKSMRTAGELSDRSFADYARVCQLLVKSFRKNRRVIDLRPEDFERLRSKLARKCGPVRLGNEINRIRVVFNYGVKNGFTERTPVYREGFHRPSKKTLCRYRSGQGPKIFEPDEIRRMVEAASQPLRSMILLGVNCGLGNYDVAMLPVAALDLAGGWIDYPRPKTGIDRQAPLWPETVQALREWLKRRPKPKDPAIDVRLFITKQGVSWNKGTCDNPVSKGMRKHLDRLQIGGHRNFYALGHSFQTISDEAGKDYGDWIVIERSHSHGLNTRQALWACRCRHCNHEASLTGQESRGGKARNCPRCKEARPHLDANGKPIPTIPDIEARGQWVSKRSYEHRQRLHHSHKAGLL